MIMQSSGQPRSEVKFKVDYPEYFRLRKILQHLMSLDPHSKSEYGYSVFSLYFDSFDNKTIHQHLNGEENRFKLRLRFYDPEARVCFLEIKKKFGSQSIKSRIKIPTNPSEIFEGLRSGTSILNYLSNSSESTDFKNLITTHNLHPKTWVKFNREAYVFAPLDGLRVTFDRDLSGANFNNSSFNQELFKKKLSKANNEKVILEVKFKKVLPQWLGLLFSNIEGEQVAYSKYINAAQLIQQYKPVAII